MIIIYTQTTRQKKWNRDKIKQQPTYDYVSIWLVPPVQWRIQFEIRGGGGRSSRPLDGGGGGVGSPESATGLDPPSFSFCRM